MKKGAIIAAYSLPPPQTRVICIDEMGPVAANTRVKCGNKVRIVRHLNRTMVVGGKV